MNEVEINSISPQALQQVHDYFAGYFFSGYWVSVGMVCGAVAFAVFIWMVGKTHDK